MIRSRLGAGLAAVGVLTVLSGCHSNHIDATIENRTGGAAKQLEVDYPSASFGADTIAEGADFHYRFQVQGSGPIKVEYTGADGHTATATGPTLAQDQDGRLAIVLLPDAKIEFNPELTPDRN
jgi:hypothetical protein